MTTNAHQALSATLQSSPALLHELGDVLETGLLTVDRDLVIRGWNRWLESVSGRAAADVVGISLLDLFPELRGSPKESAFRDALEGRVVMLAHRFHEFLLPLTARAEFAGFERMQQSARIIPIVGDDHRIDGALAVIQDVTERVAREEELRAAMERAEEANRAKSEFLASMSHELRTPLSAVIGYADLFGDELLGPVTALQRDRLDRIKASAWHLLSIVEEILSFSRLEAGRETIAPVACDACAVAREAAELLEPLASQKGLALELAVPDSATPLFTDRTKLRQVLVNLLGNATKFTDVGEVRLEVRREASGVVFEVRDTGPGIAAEHLDRIFEAFTQVDQSRTRVHGGAGLGLPVSRRIARLLGGDITVESRPGLGSTFAMWLPSQFQVPAIPSGSSADSAPVG